MYKDGIEDHVQQKINQVNWPINGRSMSSSSVIVRLIRSGHQVRPVRSIIKGHQHAVVNCRSSGQHTSHQHRHRRQVSHQQCQQQQQQLNWQELVNHRPSTDTVNWPPAWPSTSSGPPTRQHRSPKSGLASPSTSPSSCTSTWLTVNHVHAIHGHVR